MTIICNIIANIYLIFMGLLIFISNLRYLFFFKKMLSVTGTLYFLTDTVNEICVHKRYLYIPHHTCAIFGFYIFYYINLDANTIHIYGLSLSIMEYTSLIINIRTVMKNKKMLTLKHDLIMYINYFLIRCLFYPYIIFNYVNDPILYYASTSVLLMSIYWFILWTKTIYYKITHI